MRRLPAASFALLLIGCGSAASVVLPPPAPPPPPPSPTPASIAIVAGDGQSGLPATVLPVKPAVIVKDSAGAPIAGVMVHFTADSGGGSVDLASATTASSGIAQGGNWTLGSVVGTNVVTASVSATLLARFHASATTTAARTLINASSIGTGGGTLQYVQATDPLNGLQLTVPANAYHQTTQWTISAAPVALTLPAGAFVVGPAITISNGQGYADSLMALRLPVQAGPDTALAVFYYDPSSGTLEAVPVVGRDANSIMVAARHFSADQLVTASATFPASPRASARFAPSRIPPGQSMFSSALARSGITPVAAATPAFANAPPPFGTVILVAIGAETQQLPVTFGTSFLPGVDDWEFDNDGRSWLVPGGQCAGMTVSALYYNYRYKASNGALFHRFDKVNNFALDNPGGYRLTSMVQSVYNGDPATQFQASLQAARFAVANGVAKDQVVYQSLLLTMWLTGRPQLLGLGRSGGAHSVIAYGALNGALEIADPNTPGMPQSATFASGAFVPYQAQDFAGGAPHSYDRFDILGASAYVPLTTLDTYWQALSAGTVGNTVFPPTTVEVFDYVNRSWSTVTSDTIHITTDTLQLRTNCADCPYLRTSGAPATRQVTYLFDGNGTAISNDVPNSSTGASVLLTNPTLTVGVESAAYNQDPGASTVSPYYDTFRWFTVVSTKVKISPRGATGPVDSTYVFTASNGANYPGGSTFNWSLTSGAATMTFSIVNDSVLTVPMHQAGAWQVKVTLKNPAGGALGVDSTTVTIVARPLRTYLSVGGPGYSAGIQSDGSLRVWGSDGVSQLGDGDTVTRTGPYIGPGIDHTIGVSSISVSGLAGAALMKDGTVRTFGYNSFGVLGNGSTAQLPGAIDPQHAGPGSTLVSGLTGVVQVVSAGYHMLALRNDGTVWFWGSGQDGEAGNGGQGSSSVPVQVPGLSNVIAVSSTVSTVFALKNDGTVWAWGDNSQGQLGDNGAEGRRTTPAQVKGLPSIRALMNNGGYTIGQEAVLVIAQDSTVWAWGSNGFGQVGNGSLTIQMVPVQLTGLHSVIEVAGGTYNSLALKADGTVWSWGDNTYGELGDGTASPHSTPAQVPSLSGMGGIVVGDGVSGAYTKDGSRVYMWGYNGYAQLGNGTVGGDLNAIPTQVSLQVPVTP